jgi:hypothetical protein
MITEAIKKQATDIKADVGLILDKLNRCAPNFVSAIRQPQAGRTGR